MEYSLIDTHCHITCDRLFSRIEEVIANAKAHHITRMMIVCTNYIEFERAEALNVQDTKFDIAFGFHPTDLNEVGEADYQQLETLIKEGRLTAIGEIGLDYHWDNVERKDQIVGFRRQLELANTYELPILIHMREATKDTLDIIQEYPSVHGVFHCFSGSIETAKKALSLGYYISIGGPITFKNARGLPEVTAQIPADRLFVETDCPFLTPHPYRGIENEPMYVQYTFQKVSECIGMREEELSSRMVKNYQTLFQKENGE